MVVRITWKQALAWRMQRQFLEPAGGVPVEKVVRRLCGVQAQVASSAELAIRLRRERSRPGDVARALADGRLVKTWAMRGTLHLLSPEDAGSFLSLLAAGRSWEKPSWERYFDMTADRWDRLRPAVQEALANNILTREELIAAIVEQPGLEHLHEPLRSGWGSLLKPLAWQGDLCFGPARGNRVTFMRPQEASARWGGVPDPEEAAPAVIRAYLGAYGPATSNGLGNWLSRGRISKRRLKVWFDGLGDRLARVDVEGEGAFVLAEDLDGLAMTKPTKSVRLVGGFDQYVLGPGTDDGHVVPPARRGDVSQQSGWISPVVIAGGVVCGTWQLDGDRASIRWFAEAGRPPRTALEGEVARLSAILDRSIRARITAAPLVS
jgi:winged helix DNA-binding protein